MKRQRRASVAVCIVGMVKKLLSARDLAMCLTVAQAWTEPARVSRLVLDINFTPVSSLGKLYNLAAITGLRILGKPKHVDYVHHVLQLLPNLQVLYIGVLEGLQLAPCSRLRFVCGTDRYPGFPRSCPELLEGVRLGHFVFRLLCAGRDVTLSGCLSRVSYFQGIYDFTEFTLDKIPSLSKDALKSLKWSVSGSSGWEHIATNSIHKACLRVTTQTEAFVCQKLKALPNLQSLTVFGSTPELPADCNDWPSLKEVRFASNFTLNTMQLVAHAKHLETVIFDGYFIPAQHECPVFHGVRKVKLTVNTGFWAWNLVCEGSVFPDLQTVVYDATHLWCENVAKEYKKLPRSRILPNLFLKTLTPKTVEDVSWMNGIASRIYVEDVDTTVNADICVKFGLESQWYLPRSTLYTHQDNVFFLDRTEMTVLFEEAGARYFNASLEFKEMCERYERAEI